jgi:hypothetical protein
MQRGYFRAASVAALLLLPSLALAEDLSAASDLDLIEQTREAVEEQDATRALDVLIEMQRRGTGIFSSPETASCKEVIALPATIADWKFSAVARQAYFRVAMSRRLEEGSCACLFEDFSFDAFVREALGKPATDLTNADRPVLEDIRDDNRRETEARFRDLEQSCRAN